VDEEFIFRGGRRPIDGTNRFQSLGKREQHSSCARLRVVFCTHPCRILKGNGLSP
jgi:hypothetical protein